MKIDTITLLDIITKLPKPESYPHNYIRVAVPPKEPTILDETDIYEEPIFEYLCFGNEITPDGRRWVLEVRQPQ